MEGNGGVYAAATGDEVDESLLRDVVKLSLFLYAWNFIGMQHW